MTHRAVSERFEPTKPAKVVLRVSRNLLLRQRWRGYLIGQNGKIIWWTEAYSSRAKALEPCIGAAEGFGIPFLDESEPRIFGLREG